MLAETLMTPICPFHGVIKLTFPTSDSRSYERPVLVRIKDKCRGRLVGGRDDGTNVAVVVDSREHIGGLVPCALVADDSLAVPMDVFVKFDRTKDAKDIKDTASCYIDCSIVYRDHLPSLYKQHSALLTDVYDSFLFTYMESLADIDTRYFRLLERIRTRFNLRRAPFYDDQCPHGFLAWLATRTPISMPHEGFGAFLSRGKHSDKIFPKIIRPSVNSYNTFDSLWAFPAAVTHESFLIQ